VTQGDAYGEKGGGELGSGVYRLSEDLFPFFSSGGGEGKSVQRGEWDARVAVRHHEWGDKRLFFYQEREVVDEASTSIRDS